MKTYRAGDPRFFRPNAFIIDDSAYNSWAGLKNKLPKGQKAPRGITFINGERKGLSRPSPGYNVRNSFFRHGRLPLGDRHVIELSENFKFTFLDAKISPRRYYTGVESRLFSGIKKPLPYKSQTGFPYGRFTAVLKPGESCQVNLAGNAFAVAWVDTPKGGLLQVDIDGVKKMELPANQPYIMQNKEKLFIENRKGIEGLFYGMHTVTLKALKAPVTIMGVYSYDTRSDLSWERRIHGTVSNSEFKFEPAFKAVPIIDCRGSLKLKQATREKAVFSGTGTFTATGE